VETFSAVGFSILIFGTGFCVREEDGGGSPIPIYRSTFWIVSGFPTPPSKLPDDLRIHIRL